MAIRVVEFPNGGYKIRKIFAKESTYPKEILNFEFWINGELSKSVNFLCKKSSKSFSIFYY